MLEVLGIVGSLWGYHKLFRPKRVTMIDIGIAMTGIVILFIRFW